MLKIFRINWIRTGVPDFFSWDMPEQEVNWQNELKIISTSTPKFWLWWPQQNPRSSRQRDAQERNERLWEPGKGDCAVSYPKATPGSPQKTLIKFPFVEWDIGSQDRKRKWTTPVVVGGLFPRASDSAKEANGLLQTSPKRHLGWLRLTEGGERALQMKTTFDEALPSQSFGEHLVGWIPTILHGLCFQLWNEFIPE